MASPLCEDRLQPVTMTTTAAEVHTPKRPRYTIRCVAANRRQIRFLVRFALLLIVFYAFMLYRPFEERVIDPYTQSIAAVSASLLNVGGAHVTRSGTLITGRTFGVEVKNGCNGVEALFFLAAAMIAFEAPARWRLAGVVVGSLVIEVLNIVRVASLYLIGAMRPDLFETFHLAIWQTVIFGAAVFMFVYWTSRVQRLDAANAR